MRIFAIVSGLVMGAWAFGADARIAAPEYQRSAETKFIGKVTGVRELDKGGLEGIYLTVTVKNEPVEVYVGPKSFVKLAGVSFATGQEVRVTGAAAEVEGVKVILAREIEIKQVTLILRDPEGWPLWDNSKARPYPTGL
jgi:hypothetical protein